MAKMSDYGEEILVTSSSGVTFDLNKDYSKAISAAKAAGQDTTELEAQRQAKIDSAAYGGQYQTGKNESASTGTTYKASTTVKTRTSTSDPIENNPIVGVSSDYDKQYMSYTDVQAIEELSRLAKEAAASGNPNSAYHDAAEAIRAKYGYSGGARGDEYIQLQQEAKTPSVSASVSKADTSSLNDYLDKWLQSAQQQQTQTIDYGTSQAVRELVRAQQDSEATFQEQRNQIAIDEAKAKDNQALYAEARGDRGGIGAAQYDSVMNTAAQNRLTVNSAQTKLATDTARQISDLRAQGEYEKADALLTLSQQYLSQLISLEQWSMEYGLSVAQFNASLQQWQAEFEAQLAGITGTYQGTPTLEYRAYQDSLNQTQDSRLASAGETLLAAGIMPSSSQLAAMDMTQQQAQNYITAMKTAESVENAGNSSIIDDMVALNNDTKAYEYLVKQGYSTTITEKLWSMYETAKRTAGTTGSASSGYDNAGVDSEIVKLMQTALGVPDDGKWGPNTEAAAKAAGWPTNAKDAWEAKQSTLLLEAVESMSYSDLSSDAKSVLSTVRRSYPYSGQGKLPDSALDILLNSNLSDLELGYLIKALGYNLKDYL